MTTNPPTPNTSPISTSHAVTKDVRYLLAQRSRNRSSITRTLIEDDEGAATAEYAIVIMAGVALAGVLVAIMQSGEVQSMLLDLVQRAFGTA